MKNGEVCSHDGTLRSHGDLKSHYELVNGVPISSYRLKLNEGNFNNINRFILFRPLSKHYDNEIFITTMLRELGFLSPRTYKVKVKIENVISDYIFQENLKKEFLENNNKIDGPILEAAEDLIKFNKLTLARVSNKEWIEGLEKNYIISLKAIKYLNYHRMKAYPFRIKSLNKTTEGMALDEILRFKKENLQPKEADKIGTFQAAMFALGADDGLSFDDTRFYFDPVNLTLEPIYYDGDTNILSIINYDGYDGRLKKKLQDWKKVDDIILNFDNYEKNFWKYNLRNQVVSELAKESAIKVIKKIEDLDQSILLLKLRQNGMEYLNAKQLKKIIDFINSRLLSISKSNIKENEPIEINIYKKYENQMNIDNDLKLIFVENFFELNSKKKLNLEICDFKLQSCSKIKIDEKDILKLIEQENILKKNTIFLSMHKNEFLSGKLER